MDGCGGRTSQSEANYRKIKAACHLRRLIEQRGRDGPIIDWLDGLTGDCPCKRAASVSDQCHARCPDLPKCCDGGVRMSAYEVISDLKCSP